MQGKKALHVAPYYDDTTREVAQKVRVVETKEFFVNTVPECSGLLQCWLFGRQVWGDGFLKRIKDSNYRSRVLVVEGEIDAMTVAQVTSFKLPVVSIVAGAGSARKSVAANIEWLEKFDEVLLGFDADEPGHKGTMECIDLFTAGKVKIVSWRGAKDPNELLVAGKPGEIVMSIETASTYSPPGTITGTGIFDLIRTEASTPLKPAITFPWKRMQAATEGAYRRADPIVILAGSGVGKSTTLFECMAHWMDEGDSIGAIFLEDTPMGVIDGVLSVALNKRLRLNTNLATPEEKEAALVEHGWHTRLHIEEPDKITKTKDALIAKIRYLVGTKNVAYIIIDPFSYIVSAVVDDKDERRAIDKLMAELSSLCRSLNVTLILSNHLTRPEGNKGHEEGAAISLKHARGSNAIGMYAANVIGLEAPNRKKGEHAVRVIIKKSRWRGELRDKIVTELGFDDVTGRLFETRNSKHGPRDASHDDSNSDF